MNVRFDRADLFAWTPDRRYDFVFFGFWLSHVPPERFASFWSTVASALRPGGRVMFVDDGHRTSEELVEGSGSSTIERRLRDGRSFRAVKVALERVSLERSLCELGWAIEVRRLPGPFFFGLGERARQVIADKVKCTVTDAGDVVSGAKVAAGGKSAKPTAVARRPSSSRGRPGVTSR